MCIGDESRKIDALALVISRYSPDGFFFISYPFHSLAYVHSFCANSTTATISTQETTIGASPTLSTAKSFSICTLWQSPGEKKETRKFSESDVKRSSPSITQRRLRRETYVRATFFPFTHLRRRRRYKRDWRSNRHFKIKWDWSGEGCCICTSANSGGRLNAERCVERKKGRMFCVPCAWLEGGGGWALYLGWVEWRQILRQGERGRLASI